jgi:hypothetical protein
MDKNTSLPELAPWPRRMMLGRIRDTDGDGKEMEYLRGENEGGREISRGGMTWTRLRWKGDGKVKLFLKLCARY